MSAVPACHVCVTYAPDLTRSNCASVYASVGGGDIWESCFYANEKPNRAAKVTIGSERSGFLQ